MDKIFNSAHRHRSTVQHVKRIKRKRSSIERERERQVSKIKIYDFPHKYAVRLIIIQKASKQDFVFRRDKQLRYTWRTRMIRERADGIRNMPIDRQVSDILYITQSRALAYTEPPIFD